VVVSNLYKNIGLKSDGEINWAMTSIEYTRDGSGYLNFESEIKYYFGTSNGVTWSNFKNYVDYSNYFTDSDYTSIAHYSSETYYRDRCYVNDS